MDYVAQIAGVRKCWWKDAVLFAAKQYIRNNHPNEGSNTLPDTSNMCKIINRPQLAPDCAPYIRLLPEVDAVYQIYIDEGAVNGERQGEGIWDV